MRALLSFVLVVFSLSLGATVPAEPKPPCPMDLHPTVQKLRELASRASFSWTSALEIDGSKLSAHRPDIARARAAMRAVLTPGSELLAGFQRETGLGTDLQDPRFWDLYMRSYDLLGFSEAYIELLFRVSALLPAEGDVLDLGTGTCNFPAFFLGEHPKLRATAVDKQGVGLTIGREKLEAFPAYKDRFRLFAGDITDPTSYPEGPYAAVVINNVLYTLPWEKKLAVLRTAAARVPSGAPFILGDPLPGDGAQVAKFFDDHLKSAIERGAPFTDHSLLAMLAVNAIILRGTVPRFFTTPDEMKKLCQEAGLRYDGWIQTYFDGAGMYFCAKP